MNLAWELFPWKDSFLLDAPASRPRFFFFRPYVTGFVGFFMLGATALYLAFSNWSQPAIGAVMLKNDGFPVLGLAHVSPAAVDVLCVIDISQMVARVNIQGLLIPVANEQCDFDALRRRGIKVGKVEKQRCASFLLLNIINLDLFLNSNTAAKFSKRFLHGFEDLSFLEMLSSLQHKRQIITSCETTVEKICIYGCCL